MKTPNPNDIVRTATELSANHNKLELVAIARGMGWRGDHARVPMLQIALFVATKLQAGDSEQTGTSRASQQAEQPEGQQDDSTASQQDDSTASQQDDSTASQQADQPEGQQSAQQEDQQEGQPEGQQEGQQDDSTASQQDDSTASQQAEQPEGQQSAQPEGQQDDSTASQQSAQQEGQQDDSTASQQSAQQEGQQAPWDDAEQSTDSGEYLELLKQSGISVAHPMLEKVWRLAVKAKRNVLLIGGAGCGKTMIGEQLAQLLRVPFSSISCTQGMSETDLTGMLIPRVGGAFEYVSAPFVDCVQSRSVFLLDELNAADGNVLLVANSILANGFLTIPCKLDAPTIRKHPDSIIVAGLNEASDIYNSRGLLDGATLDRFYPVRIPYDVAYIKNKFVVDGKKGRARSPRWQPSPVKADQVMLNDALAWFMNAFDLAQSGKLNRIVANRFADNLVMALKAGIPFEEVKADLTADWTNDERARIGG